MRQVVINFTVGLFFALFFSSCSLFFMLAAWALVAYVGSGSALILLCIIALFLNFEFYKWPRSIIDGEHVAQEEESITDELEGVIAPHFSLIVALAMANLIACSLPDGQRETVALTILYAGLGIVSLKALYVGIYFGYETTLAWMQFRKSEQGS